MRIGKLPTLIGRNRSAAQRVAPARLNVFAVFDDARHDKVAAGKIKHLALSPRIILRVVFGESDAVFRVIIARLLAIRTARFRVNYQRHFYKNLLEAKRQFISYRLSVKKRKVDNRAPINDKCRMIDSDIFEPFERLVEIKILGQAARVPENNYLLRGFQFLSMETVSSGDFCWNGECANCQVWLAGSGEEEKPVLACRTLVREGMNIVKMSAEIEI